jgi:hypothetical protein
MNSREMLVFDKSRFSWDIRKKIHLQKTAATNADSSNFNSW